MGTVSLERAQRGRTRGTEADRAAADRLTDAFERAASFRDHAQGLTLGTPTFRGEVPNAAALLGLDVARVVTLGLAGFDAHAGNEMQSPLHNELFDGLDLLATELAAWDLQDHTTVVVLSEMGRTPYAKPTGGKDHWPYTSAMLFGAGIRGGARLGGYFDTLEGLDLLPGSFRPDREGTALTPNHLGATLLTLAGLPLGQEMDTSQVLAPVLA